MTEAELMALLVEILKAGGMVAEQSTLGEAALTWLQVGGHTEMTETPCVVAGRRLVYFQDMAGPEAFQGVDLQFDELAQANMPQWMAIRWLQGTTIV